MLEVKPTGDGRSSKFELVISTENVPIPAQK